MWLNKRVRAVTFDNLTVKIMPFLWVNDPESQACDLQSWYLPSTLKFISAVGHGWHLFCLAGVHSDQLMGTYWASQIFIIIIPAICDFLKMYSWFPLIMSKWAQLDHSNQVWGGSYIFQLDFTKQCFIDVHKNKDFQSFEIYLPGMWRIC